MVEVRSDADCARQGAVDVTGPHCSAHGNPEVAPAASGSVKVNSGREEDRSTLEEPEPKRAKPDNGGTGMELDSLRKIVTVQSWTQVVAGPTPEESPSLTLGRGMTFQGRLWTPLKFVKLAK